MGKRLKTSGDEFALMLEGLIVPSKEENYNILGGESPAIIAPARRLAKIMLKEKLLKSEVDPSLAIDKAFQECIK